MKSQGANKGQSRSAVELTEGISDINSLHVFLHCVFVYQTDGSRANEMCVAWLALTHPCLLAVLLVLCYYIHYQGILQSTHTHVSTHTMTHDTLLLDSQFPDSFFKHASSHSFWPSGPLCRCLAEAHKELPDERKAGGLRGWLSRWKGDCCRGAG